MPGSEIVSAASTQSHGGTFHDSSTEGMIESHQHIFQLERIMTQIFGARVPSLTSKLALSGWKYSGWRDRIQMHAEGFDRGAASGIGEW